MTTATGAVGLDPTLFGPDAVSEETRAANALMAEQLAAAPPTHEQDPVAVRRARLEGTGRLPAPVRLDNGEDRSISGPAGDIPLRVFVPETVNGVYLHIHGGGWVLGTHDQQDERLWETAQTANVAVVSAGYRLAPEDPYPAGPDDCETAATWLAEHAVSEFGSDVLTIGGESAGGHLSAVTLLRMRDRHGFTGFAGANLVYGAYDLGMTPSQTRGTEAMVIPTATMEWFYDYFVPAEQRRDPDVSPLYSELHDLPPALFTVGTLDPLLDDSLFMHQRWLAAGNDSELAVYPGGVHGFNGLPITIGTEANAQQYDFIKRVVDGA
ncbi:MAG: alpha/beta hydrolase [Dehalococcoidia bacterium]|nr:alpha/beta hydrolase [Dehalococcoidia bacterium]